MSSPLPCQNLERKCQHDNLTLARSALERLPARCEGQQEQIDTYYHARQGRLKLRVIHAASWEKRAELIWYDRPDEGAIRASTYHRVAVEDAEGMHAVLSASLAVRKVVKKKREVWHWHNVRIHLDEVDDLGSFIEFEAVIDEHNDEAISLVRLEALGNALDLNPRRNVTAGYADLLGD
jgi:predicted adenylyl cyclase CyaB